MPSQHSDIGALVRGDYDDNFIWRLQWMRNSLKMPKEWKDKHAITTWKILRCGLFCTHKFVRVQKMFYTACECIEVNEVMCDNFACPKTKYVTEQWGMSKYPKRFDFVDSTNDTTGVNNSSPKESSK